MTPNSPEKDKEFIDLITTHQGIIHKVCSVYCQNETDREDLFQEVLLQVWKSYASFKGDSKISTWLYRVALNTAISMYRQQIKRGNKQELSLNELQLADKPTDTAFEERLKFLYQAIDKLNKIEKAIVMLYLEDYDYRQISDIVGITETNVGVKLHRIKDKLRKMAKNQHT
ncbi:MAG TPA: sigma-70 family RNA polymerase sigma factor [Chitinophagales bacterium]|nr:sigma-70 family RNA polymerase sigma factor [Chitinophagales bacterium]HRK28440.1 sigma-70 family RNA polymerase sigma factor [Chitinophagales bacterium]